MDRLVMDLRLVARSLHRSKLTSALAVATLALAVGSNVAVFSIVNTVLLRPLPFDAPERLVLAWNHHQSRGESFTELSYPDFLEWRRQVRSFARLAVMASTLSGFTVTGSADPIRVQGQLVSLDFFEVLGTRAAVGRALQRPDHDSGADRVIVLSNGLWLRLFGGDPSAIGGSLVLNGEPFTVVGVMPPGFAYPRGAELWTPLERMAPELVSDRSVGWTVGVARLAAGATAADARVEASTVADRLARTHTPAGLPPPRLAATVRPFADAYFEGARAGLFLVWGSVGLVFLVGLVNLAGVVLMRGFARQGELAIRLALGAGPRRAVRPLVLDSVTWTLLGGVLGVILARGLVAAAVVLGPREVRGSAPSPWTAKRLAWPSGWSSSRGSYVVGCRWQP